MNDEKEVELRKRVEEEFCIVHRIGLRKEPFDLKSAMLNVDAHGKAMFEKVVANEDGALTVNILRTWDREKIERFALHLLGDEYQNQVTRLKERVTIEQDVAIKLGERATEFEFKVEALEAKLKEAAAIVDGLKGGRQGLAKIIKIRDEEIQSLELKKIEAWEEVAELNARLSQAEAGRKQLILDFRRRQSAFLREIWKLKPRLSHLMDVAGKMAEELKEVCKYVKAPCNMDTTDLQRLAMWKQNLFALAEWDGIKDGGK